MKHTRQEWLDIIKTKFNISELRDDIVKDDYDESVEYSAKAGYTKIENINQNFFNIIIRNPIKISVIDDRLNSVEIQFTIKGEFNSILFKGNVSKLVDQFPDDIIVNPKIVDDMLCNLVTCIFVDDVTI